MSSWYLVQPSGEGERPYVVDLEQTAARHQLFHDQQIRDIEPIEVFRIDWENRRLVQARLEQVTTVAVEDVVAPEVLAQHGFQPEVSTGILPPPRPPRREAILNGDDAPPSYDDLDATALPSGGFGPFKRRSD